MNKDSTCRIETGDFVRSSWQGPNWTPYAEAIAAYYPIQVPWYLSTPVTLPDGGAIPSRLTRTTRPYQHDVLIFGFAALINNVPLQPDNGDFIYLNITHKETGIPWVAPNTIGYSPLPAFAGVNLPSLGASFANLSAMPVLRLPEAFFLPARTILKLDWTYMFATSVGINLSAVLTMVGTQLINPKAGFRTPTHVTMTNGDVIPVGSRLPWFATVPFGERPAGPGTRQINNFTLPIGQQRLQFLPPANCTVEIHDTYANFLSNATAYDQAGSGFDASFLTCKLTDKRSPDDWTPGLSPTTAVFGSETQVNPAMPFTMPHELHTGHRTGIVEQNNATAVGAQVNQGTVTFRGVRFCEF